MKEDEIEKFIKAQIAPLPGGGWKLYTNPDFITTQVRIVVIKARIDEAKRVLVRNWGVNWINIVRDGDKDYERCLDLTAELNLLEKKMKDKQLILVTELPEEKDSKPSTYSFSDDIRRHKAEGFNTCLSEIKSKARELDVEGIFIIIYNAFCQCASGGNNKQLEFGHKGSNRIIINCEEVAEAIKQALERGELWREG